MYDKTTNELLANAEYQFNRIAVEKAALEKFIEDNSATPTDIDSYNKIKEEVDKVRNETAKKLLLELLERMKAAIDEVLAEFESQQGGTVTSQSQPQPNNETQANTNKNPTTGYTTPENNTFETQPSTSKSDSISKQDSGMVPEDND